MSSGAGIGPDGKIYCKHMEEAAKHKSNTPKHPNREFYCCKRPPGDQTRCNFWSWADQLFPKENTTRAPSSSARSPSKEGTSLRASAGPASTPHKRPLQKYSSPSGSSSEIVTLRSRKRLENIEVGLKQREHDLSPTRHDPGPSKEEPSPPLSTAPAIPQPPSPVPTEVDEVEVQPRKTYSFLGLHYSPESIVSAIKDEGPGQPSTPKKPRLSQSATDVVPSGGGSLLTPPQTTRRITESDQNQPLSHNRKGKERDGAQDQDSNNGEPQAEDSLPLFTLAEDMSRTSSVSPTTAENVLDYTGGMKERVKALSEYMESFDVTQAAKMLQTVERQKMQYESRDRSQKMRIAELVAERDKLAAEVSRLKETLKLVDRNI